MKTPRSFRNTARNTAHHTAFTLIELLVVIAIIAVLMGLLLPALGAVRTQARKVSAKNDVMQIVTAVKNFYTDYGRYPLPAAQAAGDVTYGPNSTNSVLFNILTYVATDANAPTVNPRQVRYLEIPNAKDTLNPKSGLGTNGAWYDPWGIQYSIFIDGAYDNDITVSGVYTDVTANPRTGVGAASYGPDTFAGTANSTKTGGNGKVTGSDDLISWQ